MSDETKRDDGGPAFPMSGDPECDFDRGMSLRDWFAGMAMQGILSDPNTQNIDVVSAVAYQMADNMLHARKAAT